MDCKISIFLIKQHIRENRFAVNTGLSLVALFGCLCAVVGQKLRAIDIFASVHRSTTWSWLRRLVEPYIVRNRAVYFSAPSAESGREEIARVFGNRLMTLKEPGENGESGVLFVMMSETFRALLDWMDVERLLRDFTLVFEPSWSGYCHRDFLEYTRWPGHEVFVLSAEEGDFAFLERMKTNLIPVSLGPCDWVDPRVAEPYLGNPKEFDIVMNSNWSAFKRHFVLFRMLAKARKKYRVLLLGWSWGGRTRADIERLADYFGVREQLVFYNRISYAEVMDKSCRSKVSILLSLKEGSNRAIADSIFCDLPVIVLSKHVGGIRKNVVAETGLLVPESGLEAAIERLLAANLEPRRWGLENISCLKSTEKLNAVLREHALKRGEPWTRGIAVRSNSPESKYFDPADEARLTPFNEALAKYVRQ
jgi:glycosyltransferase involved in cell wall biosynthesis